MLQGGTGELESARLEHTRLDPSPPLGGPPRGHPPKGGTWTGLSPGAKLRLDSTTELDVEALLQVGIRELKPTRLECLGLDPSPL